MINHIVSRYDVDIFNGKNVFMKVWETIIAQLYSRGGLTNVV